LTDAGGRSRTDTTHNAPSQLRYEGAARYKKREGYNGTRSGVPLKVPLTVHQVQYCGSDVSGSEFEFEHIHNFFWKALMLVNLTCAPKTFKSVELTLIQNI
jgi:hypothetical protein